MIEKQIQKLNQKVGEAIYLSALKDIASGRTGSARPGALLWTLSALVVASPFVLAILGLVFLLLDFPNLITIVLGVVFLGLGCMLRPRKNQMPEGAIDRKTLPETFALLDAISAHLGAPKVSKVVLNSEFNAFATEVRQDTVVGIGAMLWLGMSPEQRLAVLGHELGHLANRDVRRMSLPHRALIVLEAWHDLVSRDHYVDEYTGTVERESHGLMADLFSGVLGGAVEALMLLILKLQFAEAQKAEYLADVSAVKVAGQGANSSAFDRFLRFEASEAKRSGILPRKDETGFAFLNRLAATVDQLSEQEATRALTKHHAEKLSLDTTHPPTAYRQAFVNGLPEALVGVPLTFENWAAVDAELQGHFNKIGEREIVANEVQ